MPDSSPSDHLKTFAKIAMDRLSSIEYLSVDSRGLYRKTAFGLPFGGNGYGSNVSNAFNGLRTNRIG